MMVLLLLLGLGGIGGGIIMLMDPSGKVLGLPAGLLDDLFISDFFWPGIFLIVMMGFTPYVLFYGIWKGYPWARPGVLAQGSLLVGWIIFQFILWGDPMGIQILYLIWGFALVVLASLPSSRESLS